MGLDREVGMGSLDIFGEGISSLTLRFLRILLRFRQFSSRSITRKKEDLVRFGACGRPGLRLDQMLHNC